MHQNSDLCAAVRDPVLSLVTGTRVNLGAARHSHTSLSLTTGFSSLEKKYETIYKVNKLFRAVVKNNNNIFSFSLWRCDPTRIMASSSLRFLDHTQRRTTVGRTPLDEWSARRRDLCLTTHNTHNKQTSLPPVGFDPTISASERPQTYALDRVATGTDIYNY